MSQRLSRCRSLLIALVTALLTAASVAGCASLPTDGRVETRPDPGSRSDPGAPYFDPPGPTSGATPEEVVRGFLLAMQALPASTTAARRFLTRPGAANWRPAGGTLVYDSARISSRGTRVTVQFSGSHRVSSAGVWDSGTVGSAASLPFRLVRENGEWRIANPPSLLTVPAASFGALFNGYEVYFFDRSGEALVPVRVYLPRGGQVVSGLIRGLLAGPPAGLEGALVSAIPAGTELQLGVSVGDNGIAEIPLTDEVATMTTQRRGRIVNQIAWTLRQVPGVARFRITVDGRPLPLPGGGTDARVSRDRGADPVASSDPRLAALVAGRGRLVDRSVPEVLGGPFGSQERGIRSIAVDPARDQAAGVVTSGRQVLRAATSGSRTAEPTVVARGADLDRPVFDRYGRLWLLDRTPAGALVRIVDEGRVRTVTVPGISGRAVRHLVVTRDGARLVAVRESDEGQTLLVAPITRSVDGAPQKVGAAIELPLAQRTAPVRDLGQSGPTTVVVLSQGSGQAAQVSLVELDGSPGVQGRIIPELPTGAATGLAVSPDPRSPTGLLTSDGTLWFLDDGTWVRSDLRTVRAISAVN